MSSTTFYQCEGCHQPLSTLTKDGKMPAHGWYEGRRKRPCDFVGTRRYIKYEGAER